MRTFSHIKTALAALALLCIGIPAFAACPTGWTGFGTCGLAGTAALVNTGTSGHTVPFLDGNWTQSGNITISGTAALNGALSGTGLTNYLKAPAAIGGTTPAAIAGTTLSATGAITTTGADGSQFRIVAGAQEWDLQTSSNSFYVSDITNSKFPFVIGPNTANSLTIGTSTNAFVGPITGTTSLTLGANGGTGGSVVLKGSTSGASTIQVPAAAGTGTIFQLPGDNGTSGYSLVTDGFGGTSWASVSGGGGTPANPTATAGPSAVNGSASTYMRSDAAPAVQKASSSQFGIVEVDNTTVTASSGVISAVQPAGANPSGTAGPSAVNGSATTFMRSDAAPAVQKASAAQFGIVEVDNSTITASSGVISAALPTGANPSGTAGPSAVNGSATTFMRSDAAPAVQKATTGQFGIVEPDGTTITISGGVISSVSGGAGTVTTITAGTNISLSSGATCTTTCTINATGGSTSNAVYAAAFSAIGGM